MGFQKLHKLRPSSNEHLVIFKNLALYEERHEKPFLNETAIQKAIESNVKMGKRGIREIYGQVNLRSLISVDEHPSEQFFSCYLLPNQVAWYYTDAKGVTRYCTKNRHTDKRYDMDLVDLMAFQSLSFSKSDIIEELKSKFAYVELEVGVKEETRYKKNVTDFKNYMKENPDMFTEVDFKIYETIHYLAAQNLFGGYTNVNGKGIFFTAITFIQEKIFDFYDTEIPKVTVASKINWFATIGLIEKVNDTKIPKELLEVPASALEEKKGKPRNRISYYQLNTFSEESQLMKKRVKALIKYGITYDKISKNAIARLISLPLANAVYPFETTKKKEIFDKEKNTFVEQFYLLLKKDGFVTKEALTGILNKNLTNKLWTALTKQTAGLSKKLTKQLRELFQVSGTGAIFFSNAFIAPFTPVEEGLEEDETIEKSKQEGFIITIGYHGSDIRMWGCG